MELGPEYKVDRSRVRNFYLNQHNDLNYNDIFNDGPTGRRFANDEEDFTSGVSEYFPSLKDVIKETWPDDEKHLIDDESGDYLVSKKII